MRRTGPLLVLLASAVVGCTGDDEGCWEQSVKGWIPLTSADGGALDASVGATGDAGADVGRRRPPVVVVEGEDEGAPADAGGPADAAAPPVNRDDAGGPDAGASDAGAADAGASEAGVRDATFDDGGPGAAPLADAGADGGPDWSVLTCDRICAARLGDGWVIRGCRPPIRGDATGRLYVYCEATYGVCASTADRP